MTSKCPASGTGACLRLRVFFLTSAGEGGSETLLAQRSYLFVVAERVRRAELHYIESNGSFCQRMEDVST